MGRFPGSARTSPTSSAALSEDVAETGQPRQLFYGRRRGRPLRAGQRERQTALLPRLSFDLPRCGQLDPATLFPKTVQQIWLEIGFGGGEHLAEQAESHPETGFIGCEV